MGFFESGAKLLHHVFITIMFLDNLGEHVEMVRFDTLFLIVMISPLLMEITDLRQAPQLDQWLLQQMKKT